MLGKATCPNLDHNCGLWPEIATHSPIPIFAAADDDFLQRERVSKTHSLKKFHLATFSKQLAHRGR